MFDNISHGPTGNKASPLPDSSQTIKSDKIFAQQCLSKSLTQKFKQ